MSALEGVRVLDFTTNLAGPYATRLMADLGAAVTKVEAEGGDHARTRPPLRNGHSTYFGHVNHGKRSLVLDLKSNEDRDVALKLAAGADVVVENWRPGVAKALGLGHDVLLALKPDLVYCSISGYGQQGPGSLQPAYAPGTEGREWSSRGLSPFEDP